MTTFIIRDINPTPWMAPKLSIARSRGGVYPVSYPQDEMVIYQESIKDYLREQHPEQPLIPGPRFVLFRYWRCLNFGGQRRNRCDVTNLNKCLEDALQGVLFENDVDNAFVAGMMVEQRRDIEPKIVIDIEPYTGTEYARLLGEI